MVFHPSRVPVPDRHMRLLGVRGRRDFLADLSPKWLISASSTPGWIARLGAATCSRRAGAWPGGGGDRGFQVEF